MSIQVNGKQVRERIERLAHELLPHKSVHISKMTRAIGLSERTIERRLAQEGVTFLVVYNAIRLAMAREIFRKNPRCSITECAWRIGFDETTSFNHALTIWTGQTPKQLRAEAVYD